MSPRMVDGPSPRIDTRAWQRVVDGKRVIP